MALTHVASGSGELIQIGGFGTRFKVHTDSTGGSLAVVEHTLEPGLIGAPMHRHRDEDETSFVLEGELTVQVGEQIATVAVGDFVVKPRGVFHTFWNAGPGRVRFMEIISPGGFERYFSELLELVIPGAEPDMEAIGELAARYGLEFDFAGLPRLMQAHGVRLG